MKNYLIIVYSRSQNKEIDRYRLGEGLFKSWIMNNPVDGVNVKRLLSNKYVKIVK